MARTLRFPRRSSTCIVRTQKYATTAPANQCRGEESVGNEAELIIDKIAGVEMTYRKDILPLRHSIYERLPQCLKLVR